MTDCVDNSNQLVQNTLNISNTGVVDGAGRYTLAQIDAVTQSVAESIVRDAESNPLGRAINKYGDGIYKATDYLNGLLRQKIGSLDSYPDLADRWRRGNISNIEMADFLQAYNYVPDNFLNEGDSLRLARNLDSYYKNDFNTSILGGFCNKFDQFFASVDAFFDLIGTVEGIIADAMALVNKIRSYDGIQNLFEEGVIRALIKEIKDKIKEVVDKVFKEVQDIIDNFDPSKITEGAETFVNSKVVKGIMTTREQMCAFFTEENKKSVKDKLVGLIDYAVSLFNSPGIEEIQYLVARVCALAGNIEALIRDINKPLDDYTRRYSTIVDRLKTISRVNESTAVRAGAIRYSPTTRQEVINRLEGKWTSPGGTVVTNDGNPIENVKPITPEEYKNLPRCGNVFSGADSTFGVEGDSFDEKEGDGIYAWTRVDLDVKVYLVRTKTAAGVPGKLTITEGWVSKAYNKKADGPEDNSHLSGLVVDVKKSDIPNPSVFIEQALKNGFKYVKEYDDKIHLDIREII